MAEQYIPNYIKRKINYNPRDILTAQEYNAILNLIITQGDYNSSWLEYLQNDAIPDAIRDLSIEQIEEALTVAVREELEALSSAVQNKTSDELNYPMFTILNTGLEIDNIESLNTMILEKSLKATYAVATNLIDNSAAYPTLAQLITLKAQGNDIVAYSTDAATVTPETVDSVVNATMSYMNTNGFNTEVFVYPNGNTNNTVRDTVCETYNYGVNILNNGTILPDGLTSDSPSSVLGNIAVINFDNTVDLDVVKAYIDNIVQHNKYMILHINTDSANYNPVSLDVILDYVLSKSGVVYPDSISEALHTIHDTIDNRLLTLEHISQTLSNRLAQLSGVTFTEVDGVKYINW